MNITVVGTGFVGVVSSAVYASLGHKVTGLDISEERIKALKNSKVPFFEPGLEELLESEQNKGGLTFTTSYTDAIPHSDLIIIAVGTPSSESGEVDLRFVHSVVDSVAPLIKKDTIIAVKSTVPPGTFSELSKRIKSKTDVSFYLASLPEFLKEGSAVEDSLHPDRVVIGSSDDSVIEQLKKLHEPLGAPLIVVSAESAQMGKYAANSYLAIRITFINEIANLCEANGSDIDQVIDVFGHDARIGKHYWYPGFGYGGSCFPKDVKELSHVSKQNGDDSSLFSYITQRNTERIPKLLEEFEKKVGGFDNKKVAVLGLSFKPNTDDTREAPSLHLIPLLLEKGAEVQGYDPKASVTEFIEDTSYSEVSSIEEACEEADVIFAVIEWNEITSFDFSKVFKKSSQYFIDARNQFSSESIKKIGFNYIGIGKH